MSNITCKVAGTTFDNRQGYICNARKAKNCYVFLRRDRNNKFDKNAIAVMVKADGKFMQVGFVPATIAKDLAPALDAGAKARVRRFGFVGGGGYNHGMRLTIEM